MNQARVGVHPRMQAHRMTDLEWVAMLNRSSIYDPGWTQYLLRSITERHWLAMRADH